MSSTLPRVFHMAGWFKAVSAVSTLLIGAAGAYYLAWGTSGLHRAGGVALVAFGVAGFLDTMVSRIILDADEIHVVSLVRRRRYPRTDFESAKVDGGAVVLKRRDGGWLRLPDTGSNALSVRNTVHAWIKAND